MTNATLGLRRRNDAGRDTHGEDVPASWGGVLGPWPGHMRENADGRWTLGLDPAAWPIREKDLVIGADGRGWLVADADLLQNSLDSTVDWIRVNANERSPGGTEPGGAWFVARYAPDVGPSPEPVVQGGASLFTGEGPPTGDIVGPQPGDEYLDVLTGVIYQLGGP